MNKVCLYCKRTKPASEFSQEHILPRGVGGNLNHYNPFSIHDVCARCNNLCGLFVDGPFIKSWFINNHRAEIAKKYCHLTSETILPLVCFGEVKNLNFGNKICEFWLGPTGDTIYHFHEPYPENLDSPSIVGVPPTAYKKKIDYGFVFFFIRSNNPIWHPTIIFSILSNFKKSEIYLGNGDAPYFKEIKGIPSELKELHDKLISIQGTQHKNSIRISIDYADRFLCKLALGIGSLSLNSTFKESKSADLLRAGLWTKNKKEREALKIYGSGFLANKDGHKGIDEILKWPGGHTIAIIDMKDRLALYSSFYEANSAVIQISEEPELWKNKINEGIVYIIVPSLNKAVGPISLDELIAHKHEPSYTNQQLKELEEEMSKFSKLPPFDI